jgi:hypothetical protein
MATRIPVREWLAEPDEVIQTVVDIYEQRAADKRKKK